MGNQSSIKKNMMYNTIGSLVYYGCHWLMSVIVVKLYSYEEAGILSLAMTVTASPALIGLFNIRSYQVSDLDGMYTSKIYIRSRTVTNILAYIVCIFLIVFGGYSLDKTFAILCFMFLKVAEGYADVLYGIEQKNGRLDYAGISLFIRGIGTIAIFIVSLLFVKSLSIAILLITAFYVIILLLWDVKKIKQWSDIEDSYKGNELFEKVKSLVITCVPLAIVAFLNNFSFNVSKIALENWYGTEIMGYYSSVSSPTLVVQLAATTVFAPLVPYLTEHFYNRDRKAFKSIITRFYMILLAFSVVCVIGSKLFARMVLVMLFNKDIEKYVYLFIPIVLISILLAVNASLFSICTLIREIKTQYFIGIVGIVVSFVSLMFVKRYGIEGVVWAQFFTIGIQILVQIIIIAFKLKKYWNKED